MKAKPMVKTSQGNLPTSNFKGREQHWFPPGGRVNKILKPDIVNVLSYKLVCRECVDPSDQPARAIIVSRTRKKSLTSNHDRPACRDCGRFHTGSCLVKIEECYYRR